MIHSIGQGIWVEWHQTSLILSDSRLRTHKGRGTLVAVLWAEESQVLQCHHVMSCPWVWHESPSSWTLFHWDGLSSPVASWPMLCSASVGDVTFTNHAFPCVLETPIGKLRVRNEQRILLYFLFHAIFSTSVLSLNVLIAVVDFVVGELLGKACLSNGMRYLLWSDSCLWHVKSHQKRFEAYK